jgi:hypothetical protein
MSWLILNSWAASPAAPTSEDQDLPESRQLYAGR